MFEKVKEVALPTGTTSPWPSNLAVCWLDTRNITYIAVIQSNNVHVGNWDTKADTEMKWETICVTDATGGHEKLCDVTTVGLVHPNSRNFPVAVVGSSRYILIYDVKKVSNKPMFSINLATALSDHVPFQGRDVGPYTRGVSCNDNAILVGTHTGEIVVVMSNGDSNFTSRKNLKEHHSAITDIATCRYDEITVSTDTNGELIIWQKPIKGVSNRLLTKRNITVINVLRKQVIVGTLEGLILYYSVATGDLMCEVSAHSRPVSSISVAPESAYVLTSSEDGIFHISKLHTRKPHPYEVEHRFMEHSPTHIFMGAQFTNGRGSALALSVFDSNLLLIYKIVKKTATEAPEAPAPSQLPTNSRGSASHPAPSAASCS